MTHIYNEPADFAEDSLAGFVKAHAGYVRQVPGGVVRRSPGPAMKVAVIFGGGSGHYPAFAGLVGPGFGDGAVVGNIFTSPSAQYAYSVAKHADRGGGVVFSYGNYAGDVMNFGLAAEQLRAEGVDAREVVVTDDVLSASNDERHKRRGIAGDFVVYRVLAAAAEAGLSIDDVQRAGERANASTRTAGVAFSGCTFPGANHPLFVVEPGTMAIGLGVHGEPGLETVPRVSSKELAEILLKHCTQDMPPRAGRRVAVVLNGLGATKCEELFILWNDLAPLLEGRGFEVVEPEIGEIVTSLDMAGVSLTLAWLDDELEGYWRSSVDSPGYRKRSAAPAPAIAPESTVESDDVAESRLLPAASDVSSALSKQLVGLMGSALSTIRAAESLLAEVDSVAGDGDHGRGMVRGLEAALAAAENNSGRGAGLGTTLSAAGDNWCKEAGGTSGVLWGSALSAAGGELGDEAELSSELVATAMQAFTDTILRLGKAHVGDKTMLDAVVPFTDTLGVALRAGDPWAVALHRAVRAARDGSDGTSHLLPKVGRARPHAAKSLGHPDAGALSFSLLAESAQAYLKEQAL